VVPTYERDYVIAARQLRKGKTRIGYKDVRALIHLILQKCLLNARLWNCVGVVEKRIPYFYFDCSNVLGRILGLVSQSGTKPGSTARSQLISPILRYC
jgi:hypothetical protein